MIAPADTQPLSRAQLRRRLRSARRSLSSSAQKRASRQLYRLLAQHPAFRRTKHVALYLANDGEIDLGLVLAAAQRRGKATYLPVLNAWPRTHMVFQRVRPGERLVRNRFRIREPLPQPARQRKTWALGLVLLPLVGFDVDGGRLGMGGGFYDRSLAFKMKRKNCRKPALFGVAHECQKVGKLPIAAWDVPLDGTITDAGCYTRASRTFAQR
ncbi:5-formyltetrahydrofolate cyclo-ligase [Pseudomonas matsuisoli]|uniref:5-formyltetrahydrofolate cyclo-ligase n=1 Tax=Pseudomonas matsuisoli TaxID=1515666 RepID=A0A917Q0W8_9PSED|nr:5-formyltetrahydrofolate cyclo-ligase [Pseudomonas matsuisoli]GGK03362.1 5-formyltetrahydrofolate cyclo-ligase [Pseudomonas matsuisoli]